MKWMHSTKYEVVLIETPAVTELFKHSGNTGDEATTGQSSSSPILYQYIVKISLMETEFYTMCSNTLWWKQAESRIYNFCTRSKVRNFLCYIHISWYYHAMKYDDSMENARLRYGHFTFIFHKTDTSTIWKITHPIPSSTKQWRCERDAETTGWHGAGWGGARGGAEGLLMLPRTITNRFIRPWVLLAHAWAWGRQRRPGIAIFLYQWQFLSALISRNQRRHTEQF